MKNEQNAPKMRGAKSDMIAVIVSAAVSAAFMIAGVLIFKKIENSALYNTAVLCLILFPVAVALTGLIGKKRFEKKIKTVDIKATQEKMLERREEAGKYKLYYEKKLSLVIALTYALAVLLLLDAAGLAFFSYLSPYGAVGLPLFGLALFIMLNVFCRLFTPASDGAAQPRGSISEKDYPLIYSAAKKAAEAFGIEYGIILAVYPDLNISVSLSKDAVTVYLGVYLLRKLNENELYAVFLHEFSHIKNGINRYEKYYGYINGAHRNHFGSWLNGLLFNYPDLVYCFNREMYFYVRTLSEEESADADMCKYAGAEASASLLIKCYRAERIEWEDGSYDFMNMFSGETPEEHTATLCSEEYDRREAEMLPVWDEWMKREIQSRSSTHPITRIRISNFGVEPKTDGKDISEELRAEYEKAVKLVDGLNSDALKENYEEIRKACYTEPLEKVEQWKRDGEILTPDGYRPVVEALISLGRINDVEKLCERAIKDLPDTAALYAYFTLGSLLLKRYDDRGIEYLYHALENNNNYIEDGLDMIGHYCCITGNREELDKYREKAVEYMTKDRDESSEIGSLKRGDRLSKETLPDGGQQELVKVIKEASDGKIEAAYLVRKTITDKVFSSAVVLRFTPDCPDEERREIYNKVFLYLDTVSYEGIDDWQFSLFEYESVKGAGFESVEGSLIYKKE